MRTDTERLNWMEMRGQTAWKCTSGEIIVSPGPGINALKMVKGVIGESMRDVIDRAMDAEEATHLEEARKMFWERGWQLHGFQSAGRDPVKWKVYDRWENYIGNDPGWYASPDAAVLAAYRASKEG